MSFISSFKLFISGSLLFIASSFFSSDLALFISSHISNICVSISFNFNLCSLILDSAFVKLSFIFILNCSNSSNFLLKKLLNSFILYSKLLLLSLLSLLFLFLKLLITFSKLFIFSSNSLNFASNILLLLSLSIFLSFILLVKSDNFSSSAFNFSLICSLNPFVNSFIFSLIRI